MITRYLLNIHGEIRSLQDQYRLSIFSLLRHKISGNLFDSHVNMFPTYLLVGSQLYSKEKTPCGVISKNICCDPK